MNVWRANSVKPSRSYLYLACPIEQKKLLRILNKVLKHRSRVISIILWLKPDHQSRSLY
jgi:hypothetical protein